jgi:hypothetical protein
MTITYKIWDFPTFPVSGQLFHSPGGAINGGFTTGGVAMLSPEPGGRGILEIKPSLSVDEWLSPASSWLMSKINGEIFRVRLAPTPQISNARLLQTPDGTPWDNNGPWSNGENWQGDAILLYASVALQGTNVIKVKTASAGAILKPGHVIGHAFDCYIIDDITYNANNTEATIVVKPPFRRNIAIGDAALLRPFFTGVIGNGQEMRALYESTNDGAIALEKIILNEVIL